MVTPVIPFKMPERQPCAFTPSFPPISCFDEIVSIHVGKDENRKTFKIHKGILIWNSAYFAGLFNGDFNESYSDCLSLPEEDVLVFQVFYCWIYTHRLIPSLPRSGQDPRYLGRLLPCKVYVFGDMRGIPDLQNAAIDMLHEFCVVHAKTVNCDIVTYIYENTVRDDLLRKYVTMFTCRSVTFEDFKAKHATKGYPADFLIDILAEVQAGNKMQSVSQMTWAEINMCDYHHYKSPADRRERSASGTDEVS